MADEVATSTTTQGFSGLTAGAMAGLGIEAGLIALGLATGPVGWAGLAIGAAAGAVMGGSFGFLGGKSAKKAKKYARKAAAIQQERERNATQASFLQQIRQGRVARASSLASATTSGIATSSLTTSALSSVGSQLGYNMEYLANDRRLYELYAQYMSKAGSAAQSYQNLIALSGAASSLLGSIGDLGLAYAGTKKNPTGEYKNSSEAQETLGG